MSKNNRSNILSLIARSVLAFVFVFGQTAWAAQGQNAKEKPNSSAAAKPQQPPAKPSMATGGKAQSAEEETPTAENSSTQENSHGGGQHEGIKVHGHWTIEVRNPDGSLVAHREFENSLQSSGATALASILAGLAMPGPWEIRLNGSASTPSPCPPAPTGTRFIPANDTSCVIVSSAFASLASSNVFPNLTVNSSGTGQLMLSGTAVASQTGGVALVSTYLTPCGPGTLQANCAQLLDQLPPQFTAFSFGTGAGASQAQPVQVTAGQTIAVTVNISFS